MRLTGSGVYTRPPPVPKMPTGLVELMEGLTKEVLRHNPQNVYEFCANHMHQLLEIRDGHAPKKLVTVEQKIKKAQEKVRERIEQRRRKYEEEMKKANDIASQDSIKDDNKNPEFEKSEALLKSVESNMKAPVHHEQDLAEALEVEIFHKPVEYKDTKPLNVINEQVTDNTNVKIQEEIKEQNVNYSDEHLDNFAASAANISENKDSFSVEENVIKTSENDSSEHIRTRRSITAEDNNKECDQVNENIENDANLEEKVSEIESFTEPKVDFEDNLKQETEKLDNIKEETLEQNDQVVKKEGIDDTIVETIKITDNTQIAETIDLPAEEKSHVLNDIDIETLKKPEEPVAQVENLTEEPINNNRNEDLSENEVTKSEKSIQSKLNDEQIVEEKSDLLEKESENVKATKPESVEITNVESVGEIDAENAGDIKLSIIQPVAPTDESLENKEDLTNEIVIKTEVVAEETNTGELEDKVEINLEGENLSKNDETSNDDVSIHSENNDKFLHDLATDKTESNGTSNIVLQTEDEPVSVKDAIEQVDEANKSIELEIESAQNSNVNQNTLEPDNVVSDYISDTKPMDNESITDDKKTETGTVTEENDGAVTTVDKVLVNESVIANDDNDSAPEQFVETLASETNGEHMNGTHENINGTHENLNEDILENGNESPEPIMISNIGESSNQIIIKDVETSVEVPDNVPDALESRKSDNETSSMGKSSSMDDSIIEESNDNVTELDDRTETSTERNKENTSTMDLETAAITIQKVFRTFMFKSRGSTFDDTGIDETNSIDDDSEKEINIYAITQVEFPVQSTTLNKERRTLGISRMDTVLQTVNEEKSLSLSDDSSLSSAATVIQAHVRGFLVRNRLNSNKTNSTSLVNSEGYSTSLEAEAEQKANKTVLNIHIVPEGENFLSRDESLLTSMDLSLDGSPPSSTNLHPLGYDKSQPRKQLKREDAIQSISPPSNNSGKLSEDVESVKDMLITDSEVKNDSLINEPRQDVDIDSRDNTPTRSLNIETVIEAHKMIKDASSSDDKQEGDPKPDINRKKSLTKQTSDESDVVTPYDEERSSINSDNTSQLLHSGEFHDIVLPTKVSRSDTSVVREFKNVLVYFLLWNN